MTTTKQKKLLKYELLCLFNEREKNKQKYERITKQIENFFTDKRISYKIEEKEKLKQAYKINEVTKGEYVLITFETEDKKNVDEFKRKILESAPKELLNRYNLERVGNLKIKTKKQKNKTKTQEENVE